MKKKKRQTRQVMPTLVAGELPGLIHNEATANLVALLVLGIVVWAVYGRSLGAPLIFDDVPSIVENPSIRQLWPMVGDSQHPGPLNPPPEIPTTGRPLVNLSLALNYNFGQLNPAGYRAVNISFHILSAWLLFLIVRSTLRLPYFVGKFREASGLLAFFVALLWALHPLQTESVVYITQRTELLVGFFYLATHYGSLHYWAADTSVTRRMWLALATVSCLAGMASKEVMVSAPLVVLLFERTFVAHSFRKAWQDSWPLYCGLMASWILLVALNYDRPRGDAAGFNLGVSALASWFTQAKVLLMYLKLVLWPWPLVIHYQMPYLETFREAWMYVIPVALLIAATLIAVWRNLPVGFLGAWVCVILAPTLVVPILTEVAAERRMYLPLAALVGGVVVGGFALLQKIGSWRSGAVIGGVAVLLAIVWCSVDIHRLAAYQDAVILWQDTLVHQPDNYVAHTALGIALGSQGHPNDAIAHYQEALRINPNYGDAHHNLGNELVNRGQGEAAIQHFERAIQLISDYPNSRNNLGVQLAATGQLEKAIEQYQEALRFNPNYAEAHHNLGVALLTTGKATEAIPHFEQALALEPTYVEAENSLANALSETGKFEEAVSHYLAALRLKPDYLEAHANLTEVYVQLNRIPDAITTAQKTLALARNQGATELAGEVETWLKEIQASSQGSSADGSGSTPSTEPQ